MEAVKELELIYREYEPKVTAYIRNHVSNPDDVKALCDDVFQKLLQNKETFSKEPDSVSLRIYMTTKQTLEKYYRDRRAFGEISDAFTEEQTLNAESLEKLADALEQLDIRLRDIIILHYYADTTLSIEDRPIGGMGIFIVKKSMDAVNYEYKEGRNILTIRKNI